MGLDFGLVKMKKGVFEAAGGDKELLYEIENEGLEDGYCKNEGEVLINYCGWGNPAELWFKEGLNYYEDYDGYLMRPLTAEDIYKVILLATKWEQRYKKITPLFADRSFIDNDDNTTTLHSIDGVQYRTEDNTVIYKYNDEPVYTMKENFDDPWFINFYPLFVEKMIEILENFDWDNYTLLYYVSY